MNLVTCPTIIPYTDISITITERESEKGKEGFAVKGLSDRDQSNTLHLNAKPVLDWQQLAWIVARIQKNQNFIYKHH